VRSFLLASTTLVAIAAGPAFAGSPSGVATNGAFATTGNFAFSNTTTNTVDSTKVVNPAQGSSASGANFSLGTGATPATYATNPNGAVGQLLNAAGPAAANCNCESRASVSNQGAASNLTQTTAGWSVTIPVQQNGGQKPENFNGHDNPPAAATRTTTLQNQNTVSTNSNSGNTGTIASQGPGAFALNSGTTGASGQGTAGLVETTYTTTANQTSTLWSPVSTGAAKPGDNNHGGGMDQGGSQPFAFVTGTAGFSFH
jgi:hypothetical protein